MIFQQIAFEVIVALVIVAFTKVPTSRRTIKRCLLTTLIMSFLFVRGSDRGIDSISIMPAALAVGMIAFVLSYAASQLIFHTRIKAANDLQPSPSTEFAQDVESEEKQE